MLISSTIAQENTPQLLFNQYFYLNAHAASVVSFTGKTGPHSILLNCVETSGRNYVSGYHAPFAGLECAPGADVAVFIKDVLNTLSEKKATSLTIRQAPACYQPDVCNVIHEALLTNGFVAQAAETNQYIEVHPEAEAFHTGMDAQKRRRMKKAKKMGMHVELYDSVDSDLWYDLYYRARTGKGFPVTISKEAYSTLSASVPDVYTYAGVFLDTVLIANAVFVRVRANALYYFIAAADPAYAALSPTVMLIEALYEMAVQEKCTLIDLGVSSENGVLNIGLHQFKKHLGAKDCSKRTYTFLF